MEIFKSLSEMLTDGQQLTIAVRKDGQELVVSVLPVMSDVKDKAVENIVPIVINGAPEEFDDGFINALKQGLPAATGLVSNIKDYEHSLEIAKNATAMAKKAKEEKEKAKKEFDGYIELVRQNIRENKFMDAKKCLDKAAAVKDADRTIIEKARKTIDERSGAGSIFGGPVDRSDGKNIMLGKDFKPKNTMTQVQETKPDASDNEVDSITENEE